jgi:transposase
LADNGVDAHALAVFMGCSEWTARRQIRRWIEADVEEAPRGAGRPSIYSDALALKIVAFYCQFSPLADCGRWTLRWAAAYLAAHPGQVGASPSKSTIHRILRTNNLKPHLSRYFLHISDPDFFPKMEHLVGLYHRPPPNLFFFDECPGIQVLKRLTPDLRTEEMKARLEEFEYIRNGTMDVFAFLNHADGKVFAECHASHETTTFLGVFRRHAAQAPSAGQLHYVMDNLSCHRGYPFCQLVAELSDVPCPLEKEMDSQAERVEWLRSEDKRIVIHFTPYHGSWLNLVEIWFGIMGGKLLSESFAGAEALKTAFHNFVEQWNCLLAHPFKWSYDGKALHEKAVKRFTAMLRDSSELLEVRILTNMLMLMTNLMSDYAHEVPEQTWRQLIEVARDKYDGLAARVEQEEGPLRKKKACEALAAFKSVLIDRGKQTPSIAA